MVSFGCGLRIVFGKVGEEAKARGLALLMPSELLVPSTSQDVPGFFDDSLSVGKEEEEPNVLIR
jgi:hypothetical protein